MFFPIFYRQHPGIFFELFCKITAGAEPKPVCNLLNAEICRTQKASCLPHTRLTDIRLYTHPCFRLKLSGQIIFRIVNMLRKHPEAQGVRNMGINIITAHPHRL